MRILRPVLFTMMAVAFLAIDAQAQKWPGIDKSPADILLFPSRGGEPVMKVIYSRPMKKDRDLFGSLIPYGKVWRTGANEATEITFYQNVTIAGKEVEAGTYSLFTIPTEEEWTLVFNGKLHQWGAYQYDQTSDVVRVTVPVQETDTTLEAFTITAGKTDDGANMYMGWGDTMVAVPVKL